MKVAAFLTVWARPVGAALYSRRLLSALAARGHDVEVFLDSLTFGERPDSGVERVTLRSRQEIGLGDRPGDLLYCHADYGSLPYLLSRASGAPLVYAAHNVGEGTGYGVTTLPPTLTLWNAEATADHFGVSAEGRVVLRPPFRAEDYAVRRGDRVVLVNLTESKGAHVLAGLAEHRDDLLGVLGGYGEQLPPPGVEIVGPFEHDAFAASVLTRTRVLLVPSALESWGMAAVEALCAGIPVIAHPTPGLKESLGSAGIFADRDDLDAWISALAALDDPKTYSATSRKARSRARALERLTASDLEAALDVIEGLTAA